MMKEISKSNVFEVFINEKDKKKINMKENNENNPRQTLSLAGIVSL